MSSSPVIWICFASIDVDMPQTPQAYVIDWLNQAWLRRDFPDGASEEQYELTADAADTLRYLIRLNRPKSFATESRLTSVLQLLQSLAEATDQNPETRLAGLYAERERLDAQIEAVKQGRFTTLPAERAAERAREVISQGEELLGDFHKVREKFAEINLKLRKDLVENMGPAVKCWRASLMASHSASTSSRGCPQPCK